MYQRGLKSAAGTARTESQGGREYLVLPVVALVEGVVHAMNSAYPEFVAASEFSRNVAQWNGRPVFLGHPQVNGVPVSGNSPSVLATSIGTIHNAAVKNNKLTMEAWVDVKAAEERAPEILQRAKDGEEIQISVGCLVDTDDSEGDYNGKKYLGAWHDITSDHLALLPASDEGACNWSMGCGVRAAAAKKERDMSVKALTATDCMYVEWLDLDGADDAFLDTLRAARNIPQSERDKMDAKDFAGPNRSFPIAEPQDVSAAAHSLGRAKGDRASIKAKIIAIAYRKGDSFVAQLPDDWKRKSDAKAASFFSKVLGMFKAAQPASQMGTNDLQSRLQEAIEEKEPGCYISVKDYYPVTDPAHVVYYCYDSMMTDVDLYERAFTLDADGVVTVADSRIEVEQVVSYEPVEGAQPEPRTAAAQPEVKTTGAAAPCSCHTKAANLTQERNMNKEAITKYLETATAEQIDALGKVIEAPVAAAPVTAAAAAPAAKAATFEEVLATADADTRASIEGGIRVARERKAATIKALKETGRCGFSDEALQAKTQAELDQLVALAGSNVRAAIDYSGQQPRAAAQTEQAVAAPPDLGAAIRANRGQK